MGTVNKYSEVLCSRDGQVHSYNEGTKEEVVGLTWDSLKGLCTEVTLSWVYMITISIDIITIVKAYSQEIYKQGKNFKLIVIKVVLLTYRTTS